MKINYLGKRSISSVIYFGVNALIIFVILLYSIAAIFSIYFYSSKEDVKQKIVSSEYVSYSIIEKNVVAEFSNSLTDKEIVANYVTLSILIYAPIILLTIIALFKIRKIFKNFTINKVFDNENFNCLQIVALLFLLIGVLQAIIDDYTASYLVNNILINGVVFRKEELFMNIIFNEDVVMGLILLVCSKIFKEAISMKEEQELII